MPDITVKKNKKHKSWQRLIPIIFGVLFLVAAIGIISFPFISNAYYKWRNENQKEIYIDAIEKEEDTTLKDALELAQEYNKALASGKELPAEYEDVLNIFGTGLMGYIEIPKLSLTIPIAHGVNYSTLETAVGHLNTTALPVGGTGTHCVLTGHSGLASQRLFSDLDEMEIGDYFYLKILNETFFYQVDNISVILPYEINDLAAVPGEDYCTLVTCYPFGVNTHRLLVRGTRIEFDNEVNDRLPEIIEGDNSNKAKSTWLTKYLSMLGIAFSGVIIAIVFIVFISKLISNHKRKMLKETESEDNAHDK